MDTGARDGFATLFNRIRRDGVAAGDVFADLCTRIEPLLALLDSGA